MLVRHRGRPKHVRTVAFDAASNQVRLIEQRLLPHQFRIIGTTTYQETARAITDMVVRGAGAIGATAGYGLAQAARAFRSRGVKAFAKHMDQAFKTLLAARPTAVDPKNALIAVRQAMAAGVAIQDKQELALAAAHAFANHNVSDCQNIGEHGADLIAEGARVLTHCNAGWLAFVDVGSATAPLYAAQARGRSFHVFCDETRPRSQGASLTAWELAQQGIAHDIIADNAAGHLMQREQIDVVITGADRVLAKTGEVANKIGTYTKAVLAKRHRIPFYVAIPLSTLDWELESGDQIPIEERDDDEVLCATGRLASGKAGTVRVGNPTSTARNPAFDVTPPELITGIITPVGIIRPKRLWANRRRLQAAIQSGLQLQ